ncbi:conserved Plasmodium protein, unknown function [Plasmodium gallinaceum]|uniref:RIIa domain-containing protein n=1 Tax=Plasmodium gallinaceum TaxID=5849 RepID=A0A1J1GU88_PLAGA|nr:conserved Plasmodium protein, unknown function [Plasmodium gallinaceum]CRG96097.1 conserved Plasmodium protein, unknown function [Plasmodium gallinaceum]
MENKNNFEFKKVEHMNLDCFKIPKFFEEILSEFIAKLLRYHPNNVYLFSFNYFNDKLNNLE